MNSSKFRQIAVTRDSQSRPKTHSARFLSRYDMFNVPEAAIDEIVLDHKLEGGFPCWSRNLETVPMPPDEILAIVSLHRLLPVVTWRQVVN